MARGRETAGACSGSTVRNRGVGGGNAEAVQPELHTGQSVKYRAHALGHQVIVEGQDCGPRVNADHVAGDPALSEIDVAQPVAAVRPQGALAGSLAEVIEDGTGG